LNENSEFLPNTPYGASKVFAHNLVRIYRNKYNINASCGILFNHESSRRGNNFATQKIAKAAAKIKLGLQDKLHLGNINIYRDWGHAKDYVKAMWNINQSEKCDDYVIATGESNSLKSFVDIIFNYAGLNPDDHIVIDPEFYRKYEKTKICGDPSKLKNDFDWKTTISFKEMAIEMYEKAYENINMNIK